MHMSPLAALIQEVKDLFLDSNGVKLSNGDIARRSGNRLTRQHVQQFATDDQHRMPGPDKVLGLSLGLQVPYSVVLDKVLDTFGYRNPPTHAEMQAQADAALTSLDEPSEGAVKMTPPRKR